jgi:hypothetical protein
VHLILRYPSGRLIDGILLAATVDRLRIVVKRLNETIELHMAQGKWVSERGERVEIEGWLADGTQRASEFFSRFRPRVSSATH